MDDRQHPLVPVVKHFLTKGLIIVGVWGVKHMFWRRTRVSEGKDHALLHQLLLVPFCSSYHRSLAWAQF